MSVYVYLGKGSFEGPKKGTDVLAEYGIEFQEQVDNFPFLPTLLFISGSM